MSTFIWRRTAGIPFCRVGSKFIETFFSNNFAIRNANSFTEHFFYICLSLYVYKISRYRISPIKRLVIPLSIVIILSNLQVKSTGAWTIRFILYSTHCFYKCDKWFPNRWVGPAVLFLLQCIFHRSRLTRPPRSDPNVKLRFL